MRQLLNGYIHKINIAFEQADRYRAHADCKPILEEMVQNKAVLFEIIKDNLSNINYLNRTRHYSTLSMTVVENSQYSLLLNIFPPLPNRSTDISFQSIHHHGNLLLTTGAIFGPGYSSILFKKGFTIDFQTGKTKMEIDSDYQNHLYNVVFVDAFQPHIVFYPPDFSATLALWSNFKIVPKEALSKLGFLKKFKAPLRKLISACGLAKMLGINEVAYFDFYVENNAIVVMKERKDYEFEGDNDNFLQNIFCFIQKAGFTDTQFLSDLYNHSSTPVAAKKYINQLLNNEIIQDSFFEGHLNIPKVNLHRDTVLTAVK